MKKILAIMMCLMLLAAASALAEETTEYSERAFRFRYPSNWTQRLDYDGSVILELPGTYSSVITFAIISDFDGGFTGNETTDRQAAENFVAAYTEEEAVAKGKHTVLNGSYDLLEYKGMYGIRAYGTWLLSGEDLVMVVLYGNDHILGIQMNGPEAIALEQELLDSVELLGGIQDLSDEGFRAWENDLVMVKYPQEYALGETETGVMFGKTDASGNVIAVRAYSFDFDYNDDMAAALAVSSLPQSANIDANPVIEEIGEYTVAVIRGELDSGTMVFYAFGRGRTGVVMIAIGDEAIGLAPEVVRRVTIK